MDKKTRMFNEITKIVLCAERDKYGPFSNIYNKTKIDSCGYERPMTSRELSEAIDEFDKNNPEAKKKYDKAVSWENIKKRLKEMGLL